MASPDEIAAPMVWFALFAATVFGLYFWREHRIQQQELRSASAPHRVGERYIGQVLTLTEGIHDGSGQTRLGSRRWNLRGPNVPAGTRVRVTGVDGTILIVDRLPG
jgi:membrane protein implicated in regulation of membrane protease activity